MPWSAVAKSCLRSIVNHRFTNNSYLYTPFGRRTRVPRAAVLRRYGCSAFCFWLGFGQVRRLRATSQVNRHLSSPVHRRLGSFAPGGGRKVGGNRQHHCYRRGVPLRKIGAVAGVHFLPRIVLAAAPLALRKVPIVSWERHSHNQAQHYAACRPPDARKLAPVCAALGFFQVTSTKEKINERIHSKGNRRKVL